MNVTPELVVTVLSILSANYGTVAFRDYLERRKKKKSQDNNMDEDYRRKAVVKPLLEDLKYHLEATRVVEIGFSNGDTTLGGHHLKKVSVITETDPEGDDELIAPHFQLIPAKKFERTLDGLFNSRQDWVLFDETHYMDETAALNRTFGFNTILMVAIRDQQNKWVGYIFVSWDKPISLLTEYVERVKLVAARIGAMSK